MLVMHKDRAHTLPRLKDHIAGFSLYISHSLNCLVNWEFFLSVETIILCKHYEMLNQISQIIQMQSKVLIKDLGEFTDLGQFGGLN